MCMRVENLVFLDSFFLTFALRKLPEPFGLMVAMSLYPHCFKTRVNLNSVGKIPYITYYGVDEISASERNEFLAWYEGQKLEVFRTRRVLKSFCQDDVSVLREAYRVLGQEFIQFGNIDVSLESVTIASACNEVMRKRFLKPNTLGLIPPGGYIGNFNYSNKAIMWLVYREQTGGCTIMHAKKRREYRPP